MILAGSLARRLYALTRLGVADGARDTAEGAIGIRRTASGIGCRTTATSRDLLTPLWTSRALLALLSSRPLFPAAMFGRTEVSVPDRRDGRGAASRQEREEALAGD